jgi:hypothetical protein
MGIARSIIVLTDRGGLGLVLPVLFLVLITYGRVAGQDPGLRDSMVIGNLDGSVIHVGLNEEISLRVWVKTDDSVTFVHIPLASDDDYIQSRDGGELSWPLGLWDEAEFLAPDEDSPEPGMTSQSILGYAYLTDPRDPQNFLMTNYLWWNVADFVMTVTGDAGALGDTTQLAEGANPTYDGLTWTLQDGVTQFEPAAVYPRLYLTENHSPEFSEPADGTVFDINQEFLITFDVTATDEDNDEITISADFGGQDYTFSLQELHPGYARYRFSWVPGPDEEGSFALSFTADDDEGGITEINLTINVTPSVLGIVDLAALPGSQIQVPVFLVNDGSTSYVGGFEIFIQFGSEIICLQDVTRAGRIDSWDYFNHIEPDSSSLKIVGLADVYEEGHRLDPGSGTVAYIQFWVRPNEEYIGQYVPVEFVRLDDNDNTVSDSTGYRLVHPVLDSGQIYILDPEDIVVGDINVNGIPWEVSDGVLFGNHFVDPDLYPFNPVQRAASDTNGDGVPLTLADLVLLINVVDGNIPPP